MSTAAASGSAARKPFSVSITGLAVEAQALKASVSARDGTWTSYAYSWQDCDSSGAGCSAIAGASDSAYVLGASDVSHTVRVLVKGWNRRTSATAQSAPTSVVEAASSPADTTPPSAPSGLVVGGVTGSGLTLSWSASSDDVGVVGYRLFLNGSQVGAAAAAVYEFAGLRCGTSYSVGDGALDAAGNVSLTATVNQQTSACVDTSAPSAPSGLAAGGVTQSAVTLSWSPSSDDVGVTGYRVFLNGAQVGTSLSTGYLFAGLSCGTSYTYGVAGVSAAGNVSGTPTLGSATAACPDTSAPSVPAGLATGAVTQTGVTLSWSASTDNVGVSGYRLFRNGVQVGTASTTSFAFTGLVCGTTYTLGVAAVDAAGNVSGTASATSATAACPDTAAPSTPTGLAASGVGQTALTPSWSPSSDNVGVAGYRIFRDGTQVGSATGATSYALTGLACATGYTLGVAAYDAAGNVSTTATLPASTLACAGDSTPPSTPSGLATGGVTQTGMTLSWSPSSDNVGVSGYRVYVNGAQVGAASTESFAVTGLACGTTYTLGVAALDAAGNVSGTASATSATAACPDTSAPSTPSGLATSGVGPTALTLSWSASSDNVGVSGYRLFRNGAPVGEATTTSFAFTGLACGTSYTLGVAAVDAAGNVSGTASLSRATAACADTTAPSTPSGLATSGVTQTALTLAWTASSDNVAVTGYRLFLNGAQAGTTTSATSFAFTGQTGRASGRER